MFDENGVATGDRLTIENQFGWYNIPFIGLYYMDAVETIGFADGSYLGNVT